jgi:predicted nucleic acid-binding protein
MNAKDLRQFVDTNILVYAHDRTAGRKHDRARALLTELWTAGNGCISIQVLQEFYVAMTRKAPSPLKSETAERITDTFTHWTVYSPTPADVLAAITIHRQNNISFWDAMIIRSANMLGCALLWSEDLNSGQVYEGVRVLNPFVETARE